MTNNLFTVKTETGETIDPSLYKWNGESRCFIMNKYDTLYERIDIHVNFGVLSRVIVYVDSGYYIEAGHNGIFYTGDCCKFNIGDGNIVKSLRTCAHSTGNNCIITTGHSCSFAVGNDCTINTDATAIVNMKDDCTLHINEYSRMAMYEKKELYSSLEHGKRCWMTTKIYNGYSRGYDKKVIDLDKAQSVRFLEDD